MKKSILRNIKYIMPTCIGLASILLLGFSACDFQPSKTLADERPVGGRLAQGRPELEEYIESSTGGGSGGATINTRQSGDKNNYPMLSKAEIKELLEKTDSKNLPAQIMDEMPDWNPKSGQVWNPGKVNQKALNLALERLNAIRQICGLYPLVLSDYPSVDKDDSMNGEKEKLNYRSAQYGAALMSLTKSFGHGGQPQHSGVDEKYRTLGLNATNGGNLYKLPPEKLIAAVDGYCLDPGNPNIGHRITLLSPGQLQVDIGTVPAAPGSFGCNVMQVYSLPALTNDVKSKKQDDFNYDFISYPAAGYFPLEGNLFGSPAFWHVQFNSNKYTVGSGKIIVTNLGTGEQWVEEHAGGGTIIFNKSNKWRPELGTYTFEVTGVRNKNNIPERFVFTTEFFNRHTL